MTAREISVLRDRVARSRIEADHRAAREALVAAFARPELHSLWGYTHYRCRCNVCRAANAAHKARWRANRKPVLAMTRGNVGAAA